MNLEMSTPNNEQSQDNDGETIEQMMARVNREIAEGRAAGIIQPGGIEEAVDFNDSGVFRASRDGKVLERMDHGSKNNTAHQ